MAFWEYMNRLNLVESILDRPKDDLEPAVGTMNADGKYIPTI